MSKQTIRSVKKVFTFFVVMATILWSVGLPYWPAIPQAQAAAGYDIAYIDDGGSTPDVFLNNANNAEAVVAIDAFESGSAGNIISSITVEVVEGMNFSGSPSGFTNLDLTEVALWRDADGSKTLSTTTDVLLASSSPTVWTASTSPTRWRYTFSGLSVPISTSYSMANSNRILIAAKGAAAAIAASSTPRAFNIQIPTNGARVSTTSGATLTNFPTMGGPMGSVFFSPPIRLGQEGGGGFGSSMVISEIQAVGGAATDEFVELYNRSSQTQNIEGYKILYYAANVTDLSTPTATFPILAINGPVSVPGNGFFLIGHTNYDGAPAKNQTYTTFDIPTSGFILLADSSNIVIDKVGFGTLTTPALAEGNQPALSPSANGSLERKARPASTYNTMKAGGTDETQGNSEDSNNNAMDFILRTAAGPQNASSTAETMGGGMGSQGSEVVINEVAYNVASGAGWIELYNRKTDSPSYNIAGWKLISNGKTYTIPNTAVTQAIPSGGFVVVKWNKAGTDSAATSTQTTLYTGTSSWTDLGVYGGEVALKTAADVIKDYIEYGGGGMTNESAAAAAGQWATGDYITNCLYGQSIGRRSVSGDDYNASADWQTYTSPNAGYPNMGGDSTAPNKVTNVVLVDNDNVSGSGLNGKDITISWTPDSTPDQSFDRYLLYLLPSGTSLDTQTHSPIERIYGGQYQYLNGVASTTYYAYTGGTSITKDSAASNLSNGSYVAYVVASDMAGNQSAAALSSAATLTGEAYDVGNDHQAPFIMHMGVGQAAAGANIILIARFDDDRGLGANTPKVVWKKGTDSALPNLTSGATVTDCVAIVSNYYTCTIPWNGAWGATSIIGYYLKATDEANNTGYMSASPSADMAGVEATVQANPFKIDILAANDDILGDFTDSDSNADLSGFAYKSDGSVFANGEQPYVYLEGTAAGPVQATNGTGAFAFSDNTLVPGAYKLVAFKAGYMDLMKDVFKGDTAANVYMNQGNMQFGAGGGQMPSVIWTAPNDGMMGVSKNIYCTGDCSTVGAGEMPIIIAFSKEMNPNTINDTDASNAASNIYLTTNGQDRVAGKVKYVYSGGTNEARFYAATANSLTAGTFYSIVVTQGVTDKEGNPIMGGSGVGGAFVAGFNTMPDNSNMWGSGWQDFGAGGGQPQGGGAGFNGMDFSNYGSGGQNMPAYVKGTVPSPGAFNIYRNRSLLAQFSEAMDPTSISSNSIKLYPVSSESSWTLGSAISTTVSLDQSTKTIVTITPSTALDLNTSNHGWYVLKVMGSAKSASGVWMGNPQSCGAQNPDTCLANTASYETKFQLNSDAAGDATNPIIDGTYPNSNDGITAGTVAVNVGIPSVDIAFSEPMLPSTINLQSITLKAGSSLVVGKVNYDTSGNMARLVPASALSPNTQYTLTVATSVQDLAGRNLLAARVVNFKTGGADIAAPELLYANADDYSMAITFSEPMNTAKQTDTSKWASSVLNSANFYVKGLANTTPVAPYKTDANQEKQLSLTTGLNFTYDEPTNTLMIKGFQFNSVEPHATDYQLYIDNVTDKSNNIISGSGARDVNGNNATQGPVKSSTQTFGMLGPGGGGMMMMGQTAGGTGPGMDMGAMGMKRAGAMPMNMTAGQTSMYFVDAPLTRQIPSGGQIVLTFPTGFNVASAQQDLFSPKNKDFNEWGPGTITFACSDAAKNCGGGATITGDGASDSTKGGADNDGITVNTTARTVTITINGTTSATDFLHFDLKGIVNSSVPKEFGTDGYTIDIKTMNASGVLLETISSMPFNLQKGGEITLSGTVTITQGDGVTGVNIANGQTMNIFLGSPMTGPTEKTLTFTGANTADYSFTGLSAGEYFMFTDPTITLTQAVGGSSDFAGMMMPEPLRLTASTTKNLTVRRQDTGNGTAVTVKLTGNFSTGGSADDVDIFANSPAGFRMKTASDVGDVTNSTKATLYLSDGRWNIGMGPSMPKGPMAGPPTMPDWMPPMPADVEISGATIKENSGTPNDGIITFNIASQVKQNLYGKVVDGSGNGLADAEVFGFNPNGGFGGSNTKTDTNGVFTLKLSNTGAFKVGAHKPGLPPGNEMTVDVRAGGVYYNDTLVTTSTQFQLKLKKPAYTISGQVLNASSKAMAYVPVWAYQTTGWGDSRTMTDSSGNYILYVDNGTWQVKADAPGMGGVQYDLPITINGASQSNINLKPSTDTTWVTIAGTVTINGAAQQYMPIRAVEYSVAGVPSGKEYSSNTDSLGAYTINVPGGADASTYKYYRVDIWTQSYGEVERTGTDDAPNSPANTKMNNSNKTSVDITVAAASLKPVVVRFTNGSDYASSTGFLMIDGMTFSGAIPKPTGYHNSVRVTDLSATTTLQLQAGDYFFMVDVPAVGQYTPNAASRDSIKNAIVVGAGTTTVVFDLPVRSSGMITLAGTVNDGVTALADAWLWIGNPATGFNTGCTTNSSGACTSSVPKLSSGNYMIGANKPDYMSAEPVSNAGTTSTSVTISLSKEAYAISGYIYNDANSNNTFDSAASSSEAVPNGWVRAQEITSKKMSFAPVDGTGYYSLGVVNGEWRVYGAADSYKETQYSVAGVIANLTVNGANLTERNIKLTTDSNWSSKTKSKPVVPSSGGSIDDTASGGTGVKLTLPPQALGKDTSNANISVKETSSVGSSQSFEPFGGKGKEITAIDSSNQPISKLNDYIDLEIVIYKADVDREVAAGNMVDKTKLTTTQVGYWDSTTNDWVTLPTTRSAYYKATADATEWTLYPDSATTTGYERFIDDALSASPTFTGYTDYKLVLKASTNHFSVFGATQPTDNLLPSAPSGLSQSSGSGSSVGLSWSAVTTNFDSTAITDLLGYQIYRSTNNSTYSQLSTTTAATTYTDATASSWTSYYYKVTASDDGGNETPLASSTALRVCSNKTVSNGTVSDSCAITCNAGYTVSGNSCAVSGGGAIILGGGGGGDTTAPSIDNVVATPSHTQVAISWTTNESSLTWLVYGTTTAYGSEQKGTAYGSTHSATLTNLKQGTAYHYQIKSYDSAGNVGSFSDRTVTTLGVAATTTTAATTTPVATSTTATTTATATPAPASKSVSQMTKAELQAKIIEIGQLIIALRAELAKITGGDKAASVAITIKDIPASFSFSKTLKLGLTDLEVKYLQVVLNSAADTKLTGEGIGSAGKEMDYFGGKTKQAVIKFQEKYAAEILTPAGLTKGTGIVGPTTRAVLNFLLGK